MMKSKDFDLYRVNFHKEDLQYFDNGLLAHACAMSMSCRHEDEIVMVEKYDGKAIHGCIYTLIAQYQNGVEEMINEY